MTHDRLLADIGGTNARFAWQSGTGATIGELQVLPTADHTSLEAAIEAYLQRIGRTAPRHCAIAVATVVNSDTVSLTNLNWRFSIRGLQQRFGFERLRVLNDFTALALAVTDLPPESMRQCGGGAPVAGRAIALIGPGTGLGVSGLVPAGGPEGRTVWAPLQGEGGHVTLAACNAHEAAVIDVLQRRFGHASAERALSGPGLASLHQALAEVSQRPSPDPALTAAEITRRGLAGQSDCAATLELFCALLGTTAGNLVLTLGAEGGLFIGGGIVPRLGEWFHRSPFRSRFDAKGRFSAYLSAIPVYVIHADPSPALLGAARALDSWV